MELKRQRQARRITKRAPPRARKRLSGPAVPSCDATSRRPPATDAPKTGAPGVPRVGKPGAPTDGAPGAPKVGAPRAPECGAPGVPAAGAPRTPGRGQPGFPIPANDNYTTCCCIETDVKKHVVHAWHSHEPASAAATGRADAASRATGPYDHYRQALIASTAASAADLAAFEEFLDREVIGRLGTSASLTWAQYRAFFRYWAQLGDAQAAAIAADVRERAGAGRVRSPQAYLMWALKRRATHTERDSSPSPRPSGPATIHGKIEPHACATRDEGRQLVVRGRN